MSFDDKTGDFGWRKSGPKNVNDASRLTCQRCATCPTISKNLPQFVYQCLSSGNLSTVVDNATMSVGFESIGRDERPALANLRREHADANAHAKGRKDGSAHE